MSGFGINLNYDLGNIKLDKLFDDANKSSKSSLSNIHNNITTNHTSTLSTPSYNQLSKSQVETLDLSSEILVTNKQNATSITPKNMGGTQSTVTQKFNSNNISVSSNTAIPNSTVSQQFNGNNINVSSNASAPKSTSFSQTIDTNKSLNNVGLNNKTTSQSMTNSVLSKNNNAPSLNTTSSNNASTNQSTFSANNNNTSTLTTTASNNSTTNQSAINSISANSNNTNTSISLSSNSSSNNFNFGSSTVSNTNSNTSANTISQGNNDSSGFLVNSDSITRQNNKTTSNNNIMTSASSSSSLDSRVGIDVSMDMSNRSESDNDSNVNVRNSEVYTTSFNPTNEVAKVETDTDQYVVSLKSCGITEEDINRIISGQITPEELIKEIQNDSDSARRNNITICSYLQAFGLSYTNLKELEDAIAANPQQSEQLKYIYDYISSIITYNNECIDKYISNTDFNLNKNYKKQNGTVIDEIVNRHKPYAGTSENDDQEGLVGWFSRFVERQVVYETSTSHNNLDNNLNFKEYISTKEDVVDTILCMLNGSIVDGNIVKAGSNLVYLETNDLLLEHYFKWGYVVNDTEKEVINYIYNTQGYDAAYEYLNSLSDVLDSRWLAKKTEEDQAFAEEHPIVASVASIIVTPIEGMAAVSYSLNAYLQGEKIRRAGVYSSGDIWRAQVGQSIARDYGEEWAFIYNTAMSMADTATLVALSYATGGMANIVLSATIMGSRAYVSTLNDALDRGISDGAAISLAFSSALVETAMESYSLGHLLNLENSLGSATTKIVNKISNSISNPTLASLATKSTYVILSATSQGLCEGEEEFATEIVNFVVDELISGDLSNHTLTMNNYINQGYSEEEAWKLSMKDFSSQIKQAFLGGFVSGACFGTFSGVKSTHQVSKNVAANITADFEGTKAQAFAKIIEANRLQQQALEEQQKTEQKQKVADLKTQVESVFGKSTTESATLDTNIKEEVKVIEDLQSQREEIVLQQNEDVTTFAVQDPNIQKFVEYLDKEKLVSKQFGFTDEQLSYLDIFKNKLLSFGNVSNLLDNILTLDMREARILLHRNSPILKSLIDNEIVMKYMKSLVPKDIIQYGETIPNHPFVISTLLSLDNETIKDIGAYSLLVELEKFSPETQKLFVETHIDFFQKEIWNACRRHLSVDAYITIFSSLGGYDFFKSNLFDLDCLDNEAQNALFDKYKSNIYADTQKNFIEFSKKLKDPEYQTNFIKESPFYSEIVSSSEFTDLILYLKNKEFILELINTAEGMKKIQDSPYAFSRVINLFTEEEQQTFKSMVKKQIIMTNTTTDPDIRVFAKDRTCNFIKGFTSKIQQELLNDPDIIKIIHFETMLKLNEEFDGVYIDSFKSMISGNFDNQTSKLLFVPEIYELMDQDTINRAACALKPLDYERLTKLENAEAISTVIDKIIDNNFKEISSSPYQLIALYECADIIGKQKILTNIPVSNLIELVSTNKGELFIDELVKKLSQTDNDTVLTAHDLTKISQFKLDLYEKAYKCLTSEQKYFAFNYDAAIKFGLTEELTGAFKENPEIINEIYNYNGSALNFLKLLTNKDDIEMYHQHIEIETLFKLPGNMYSDIKIMDLEKIKLKLKEWLSTASFKEKPFQSVYLNGILSNNYSIDEQLEIINCMQKNNKYFMLLRGNIETAAVKFELINQLLQDKDFRSSIDSSYIDLFHRFFDSLEAEYANYILDNANDQFLGFLLTTTNRKDLNIKFGKLISENTLILNKYGSDAELIYDNLSDENKTLLDNQINKLLSDINSEKANLLLRDATTAQKSVFIEAYNNLITEEKLELLLKIKSKNKFVLSTFNYSLFDETIYQFGEYIITKLSKYYDVVDQIVKLKNSPEKFNLFANFIIHDKTSSSEIVADQKMSTLLNYLLDNDVDSTILSAKNLSELETSINILLKEIDQFSILGSDGKEIIRERSIITPDNFTLENYSTKLSEKCDELLNNATTVKEIQNLIFNKYFSMSIEDATELFRMYGKKFFEISNLDTSGTAASYLENVQQILNLDTIEKATEYYKAFDSYISMNEKLNILNDIKQVYTRSLKETLFNPTEITGYVEYEGKKIPLYQPKGDFQMLVQSTYTNYGGMPMINNNYFDSWNLSTRTANHGICCSLISNNNMGMAKVQGPGIVIGFNSFSDEQMNMMAPYDIYTRNDGYVIKCQRPLLYLPGTEVMNETRHTHNEFNLERTNLTGEGNLANIQPDYVVVFEEMSASQKENAYKASLEFNIPLVYINKTTLAQQESAKIDNLIAEYKASKDITKLSEILVLHENNRSGYRNPTDQSLITKYFSTERINDIFEYSISKSTSETELIYIKDILSNELRKFDTTLEATHRVNEIDIDTNKLIEQIDTKILELQSRDRSEISDSVEKTFDTIPEFSSEDITALMSNATVANFEDKLDFEKLYSVLHSIYDSTFGSEYVNQTLSEFKIIKQENWNEVCAQHGLSGQEILGFVDKKSNLYLPENANMHTGVHEGMHKFSEHMKKIITLKDGTTRKVTGIREFFEDGTDSGFANEALTDYLASKKYDGVIYESMYSSTNVRLWERIDNLLTVKYGENQDILFEAYNANSSNTIRAIFDELCGEGTYNTFVKNMAFWYAKGTELNNIVGQLEKAVKPKNIFSRIKDSLKLKTRSTNQIQIDNSINLENTAPINIAAIGEQFDNSLFLTKIMKPLSNSNSNFSQSVEKAAQDIEFAIRAYQSRYRKSRQEVLSIIESISKNGEFNLMTSSQNARGILQQYSLSELQEALNYMKQQTENNQQHELSENIQQTVSDIKFAVLAYMKKYRRSRQEVISIIETISQTGDFNLMTSSENARNILRQHSLQELQQALKYMSQYNTENQHSLGSKSNIEQRHPINQPQPNVQQNISERVGRAVCDIEFAIQAYQGKYKVSRKDVLGIIKTISKTGDFSIMTSSGNGRSLLQQYDLNELEQALDYMNQNDQANQLTTIEQAMIDVKYALLAYEKKGYSKEDAIIKIKRLAKTWNFDVIVDSKIRNLLKQYDIPQIQLVIEDIEQNISQSQSSIDNISYSQQNASNVQTDISERIGSAVCDIEFAIQAYIEKYGKSRQDVIREIQTLINTRDFTRMTRYNNARARLLQYNTSELQQALDYMEKNGSSAINSNPNIVKPKVAKKVNMDQYYYSMDQVLSIIKNPIRDYNVLNKLAKTGGDYGSIVRAINDGYVREMPTVDRIKRHKERFFDSLDDIQKRHRLQGNAFLHYWSSGFGSTGPVTDRLYINMNNNDTLDFVQLFADQCEARNIPYYFKTAPFITTNKKEIASGAFTRDESIVIYAEAEHLVEYINICNYIMNNYNLTAFEPPILTGVINGYLGYGAEPLNESREYSYNSMRAELIANACIKMGRRDKNEFDLNDFYLEINSLCQNYGIDSNTFYLNN